MKTEEFTMTTHRLATLLRVRQKDYLDSPGCQLSSEDRRDARRALPLLTDEQVIESYSHCPACDESHVPLAIALEICASVQSVDQWFDCLRARHLTYHSHRRSSMTVLITYASDYDEGTQARLATELRPLVDEWSRESVAQIMANPERMAYTDVGTRATPLSVDGHQVWTCLVLTVDCTDANPIPEVTCYLGSEARVRVVEAKLKTRLEQVTRLSQMGISCWPGPTP
jgi:hypothetical protein